jgi:hypothetical protein
MLLFPGSLNLARISLVLVLVVTPALTRADLDGADGDFDGVSDGVDNCPFESNPDQVDTDGTGSGDLCDSEVAPFAGGANGAGARADPIGDVSVGDRTVARPDITLIDAVFDHENLYVTVLFRQNTFDVHDYRFVLFVDADQDNETGILTSGCNRFFNGNDLDLRSDTVGGAGSFGSLGIAKLFVPRVGVIGSVPIDFGDDSLSLAIPLSLMQTDGNVEYMISVADSIKDGFVRNCDDAPNGGSAQSAPLPEEVLVDIKPGSDPNSINPSLDGDLPVAILGSESFDVADVDVTTLAFGPSAAPLDHSHGPHFEDVNGDGLTDLLAHYRVEETGIGFGDIEACVTGETLDGWPFEGCDGVRTVPDMDGDALLDAEEELIGTNAFDPDTDGDGFGDGEEVHVMGTDPLDSLDPAPAVTRKEPRRQRRRR